MNVFKETYTFGTLLLTISNYFSRIFSMDVYVELQTDCNAAGSATWECDGCHVNFSVYGPDEAKMQEELTHRAHVSMVVTPQMGQHSLKETELESFFCALLERLVDVKAFPRLKVSVSGCRLSEVYSDEQHRAVCRWGTL